MRYHLGRCLQVAGMAGVLYGFWFGISREGALTAELTHLAVGGLVFYIGWALTQR